MNTEFAKGEALHLLTPNSSRSTSIKKRTEFQICLKNKKIPRIWFWQTYLWNYFLGERLILKKKKIARTHENITFCNTISPGVPTDLNPPVQIRWRIWTSLRRFGSPFKLSFEASFVSYLVTYSICKLFCQCSFQSQHNISSIKVKKNQPFRSNSTAFIIASRTVNARIRFEQTTAFELLKLLQ